jgi:hypothetical protein
VRVDGRNMLRPHRGWALTGLQMLKLACSHGIGSLIGRYKLIFSAVPKFDVLIANPIHVRSTRLEHKPEATVHRRCAV